MGGTASRGKIRRLSAVCALAAAWLGAEAAWAQEVKPAADPIIAVELRDTLDVWRNTQGGLKVGYTQLNKLQIAATFDAERLGRPGFQAHIHIFRTNGEHLSSSRTGDIQTASNIEALSTARLMEAWVEQTVGDRWTLQAGLIDLNADFDSIDPASLFIDSSHGIAPDLSHSGLNGPSIFPVSSLGVHAVWTPTKALTLRMAAFDGVPGDPQHPNAFAAVKLSRRDGALLIAQADWAPTQGAQASVGVWGYSAEFDRLDRPGERQHGEGGVYGYAWRPLPGAPDWTGWIRVGAADPHVAQVTSYVGAGVVHASPLPGRSGDTLGFAVARAGLGEAVRRPLGLPVAETDFEVTYQAKINDIVAVQPDVQYIVHPAMAPGLRNALAIGVRFSAALTWPVGADLH
jgi:porin